MPRHNPGRLIRPHACDTQHPREGTRVMMANCTMSLRILSFSILSFSFFCSRSVLAWYVATAFVSFWILPVTDL